MRQIAMYGKGGIGKSTITSNLAATLARSGHKVLQIGCDPKHDSTRAHFDGAPPTSVLDRVRQCGSARNVARRVSMEELIGVGRTGVHAVEAGGPEPGVGCAGRGVVSTIETLTAVGVYEADYDIIFYDVLGDVVCGGFAMPIRRGYAKEIYLVVSGQFMALYAANNICRGIARYARTGPTRLAGVIGNLRGMPNEELIITRFGERIGSEVVYFVPHSPLVGEAESARRTVIEHAPESPLTGRFEQIADALLENQQAVVPRPIDDDEVEKIVLEGYASAR